MTALVREAMEAGAIGLGSSTAEAHVGDGGLPVPSRLAERDELRALVRAIEEAAKKEREKLDFTPKPVPPGLEKMKNLFKKVLHLTQDEKHYVDKEGNHHDRVSSMKPDKEELKAVSAITKRRSVQRGNVIDKAIRELFMGNIGTREDLLNLINTEIRTNNYEIDFTKSAVDALFTSLGEIKQAADQWGWKVHSDIPVLFGNYPGLKLPQGGKVAGTIDLLVEHNGEFFLIDIKSATRDRASDEGKDMYFDSDTIQLNVYRELIEQMTGVKIAGMFIFPITVKHGPRYKTVESISAPTFGVESLIEIPAIPVRQLVPDLFEKGPEAPPAAPAAPATPAPAAPVADNKLTSEEADWLYDNLKQITEKYNTSTLADSIDPNLKTPLKFGDTTVTAIEPRAGDTSYIWFERSTGKWLISIDERNGKQYLTLSKFNDKGT